MSGDRDSVAQPDKEPKLPGELRPLVLFRAVFPGWSNPLALVALVGSRFALTASLTVTAGRTVGVRAVHTVAVDTLAVVSAVPTVLLLRGSGLGIHASYAEFLIQIALVGIAGYVVSTRPVRDEPLPRPCWSAHSNSRW